MLTITVDDKGLRALFARLLSQADDLTPVMNKIGDALESRVKAPDSRLSATCWTCHGRRAYHKYGTRRMPRRGLLFADPETATLAPDDLDVVISILTDYIAVACPRKRKKSTRPPCYRIGN